MRSVPQKSAKKKAGKRDYASRLGIQEGRTY